MLSISLPSPPTKAYDATGQLLGRVQQVSRPAALGGRGRTGHGVRIGIWDTNVTPHVDYASRVTVEEYEVQHDHGPHVTGIVLGAGLVDPEGQGMAPKARAWTYNFNVQSNGLNNQDEMLLARRQHGISITQNSYGSALGDYCNELD